MKKIIFIVLLLLGSAVALAQDTVVLDWNDCVREAVKNNPDLAASMQEVQQYKAQKWIAKSPMFPQISGTSVAKKTDTFSGGTDRDSFTYSVKGEQLIFDGFKTYNEAKSAKEDVTASQYNYTADSSDIRYNLRKAFAELLKAQTLVPITEGIITRRKQNLDMIRLRYESGGEHEGSLLLAEADLYQAQYDYRKAKRDIAVAQYALRKELGWEVSRPIRVVGDFNISSSSRSKSDFKYLADNHSLVKKRKFEKESAKYSVDSAKAEFFPEVKFSTEAGKMRTSGFTDEKEWTVGLNMSLPLFEGGQRIANTQKAKARLIQAKSDERSEYDNVVSTLEKALQGLQDAIEEVEVQKRYLKAAEVRAKISRAEYANGLLIFDNWIIIEDNYVRAQKSYVEAQAELLIAEAEWIKAKGGALDYE